MADTPVRTLLSRRTFLRYSAWSAGFLALSRLRVAPVGAAQAPPTELQVFTPRDAEIMTGITERLVFSGDSGMPAVRDTQAIATIDRAVQQLDPHVQGQLRWLMRIIEWGPPILALQLTTFTGMTPAQQDAYLHGWAASDNETRRLAFRALKNLAMLGYYSQDATWKGIHYDGPWAPRPRRSAES
jgi:gluconate 2-dehydrogenase subunit 3-like protein